MPKQIGRPFMISENDARRSSTLTRRDVGKWALLIQGTYQVFKNKDAADECWEMLQEDGK